MSAYLLEMLPQNSRCYQTYQSSMIPFHRFKYNFLKKYVVIYWNNLVSAILNYKSPNVLKKSVILPIRFFANSTCNFVSNVRTETAHCLAPLRVYVSHLREYSCVNLLNSICIQNFDTEFIYHYLLRGPNFANEIILLGTLS